MCYREGMNKLNLALAALLFPSAFALAAGFESPRFGLRGATPLPAAVSMAARRIGRLRFASVNGSVNGRPFEMSLSRSLWVISGETAGSAIAVKIDHDGKSMLGDIGGRRVELAFHWTPARSVVQGTFNGAALRYEVDFGAVSVKGSAAGKAFRLTMDAATGKITGKMAGAAVALDYNPMSGELRGSLGGRPVSLTLANLELGEFLQYFFVLLP